MIVVCDDYGTSTASTMTWGANTTGPMIVVGTSYCDNRIPEQMPEVPQVDMLLPKHWAHWFDGLMLPDLPTPRGFECSQIDLERPPKLWVLAACSETGGTA